MGKSLGWENAHWSRRRLFGLVLDRESGLAGTSSKLAVCCYIECGRASPYLLYNQIIDEYRDEMIS